MSTIAYPMNQFAPAYQQGTNQPPPEEVGFEDRTYEYVYNPPNGQLTANQLLLDSKSINTDADFYIAGWYLSRVTGTFQVQLTDASGYEMSDGMVVATAISFSASNPTVISPAHPIPAGGKIKLQLQDLSGSTNPIQIVFKGWKRFRRPVATIE